MEAAYAEKQRQELAAFANQVDINTLPESHVYCANKYWLPRIQGLGYAGIDDFFLQHILKVRQAGSGTVRMLSLGAGNCDHELRLGTLLRELGVEAWEFVCLDVNPAMLTRGQAQAEAFGLGAHFQFSAVDVNTWQPQAGEFGLVMASHSLHHLVELEMIFEKIAGALKPQGYFLVNDMIGRNGHMRWPEAGKYMKPESSNPPTCSLP